MTSTVEDLEETSVGIHMRIGLGMGGRIASPFSKVTLLEVSKELAAAATKRRWFLGS